MPKKTITQAELRKFLSYDKHTGEFAWLFSNGTKIRPGDKAGTKSKGYILIRVDGRIYRAHRLAWLYVFGVWPLGEIDHINGVRDDNRIANLRDVSLSINRQNRRTAQTINPCGVLGVGKYKWGYRARIFYNGKQRHLGTFKTAELAHAAYLSEKRANHPGNML